MLPCFVVIDLETTGGNAQQDRITEIAAVRVEHGVEVARWSSLVNPGVRIPPYIQSLTGISDAMVQDAPYFEDVASRLLELLDGAVFVAHNVRFDHGFVLHALERMDKPFKVKTLCTVRLSRKLFPAHKDHGLDAISQRHGLHTLARHRAMGDVELVLGFLQVARADLGAEVLQREAVALLQGSASVPPQLETPISDVPDRPGVYVFFGEGTIPLYIGKSVNMRTRVLSHFQASTRQAREMRILQEIRRIEWQETAGELGALLLESRWVKERQPIHNRQLRRTRGLQAWQLADAPDAKPLLTLVGLGWAAEAEVQRLSYGQRRLLEIARALASDPKVLLLDEPCAGLSQAEADDLAVVITRLKTQGLAMIVIEHNMRFVMGLVDRIVALNFGQKIGEGTPAEIRANPAVVAAYLGGSSRAAH